MRSTNRISPWIAAFSKNVDNPGTASELKWSFGDFHSTCLCLSRRPREWKRGIIPHCMNDPNRRVTWQATSDDENS